MCSFVRTSSSKVKFRETRSLITKLIAPLRVIPCCLAGLCGSRFLTAKVSELNNNLFSFVQCVNFTPYSKEIFSQWGSTLLKEWNFQIFLTTAYYQKDDRVFNHSEICELSVSGRRYVAQYYFKNTEN
jgi:hypothetical protein